MKSSDLSAQPQSREGRRAHPWSRWFLPLTGPVVLLIGTVVALGLGGPADRPVIRGLAGEVDG
jgi:hypothetical protein